VSASDLVLPLHHGSASGLPADSTFLLRSRVGKTSLMNQYPAIRMNSRQADWISVIFPFSLVIVVLLFSLSRDVIQIREQEV
jgi:hypothetical protein